MRALVIYGLVFMAAFFLIILNAQGLMLEPESGLEVVRLLTQLQPAFESNNYAVVALVILMSLTWAVKRFGLKKDGSNDHVLPWVSAGLGSILGTSTSLATGIMDPVSGALGGLMLGNAASGAYDMLIRSTKKQMKKNQK